MYSIHGQRTTQASTLSQREYSYDGAGRLTRAADTSGIAGCTVRDYGYDADSNRASITSHRPALGGGCDPASAGTTKTHGYDDADRLKDSGYQYDAFGRTQSVPTPDAGGNVGQQGTLTNTYYTDDRIHSLTQNGTTNSYQLDPSRRVRTETTTGASPATRTNHFDDDNDSPAWTAEDVNGTHWTRNVTGIDGNLVAIQDNQTGTQHQLSNLHGDIIGTPSPNATLGPILTPEPDEFGVPQTGLPTGAPPARYGWLGAKQRETALPTEAMLMGRRVYQPRVGRFLQTDPVTGGSASTYDYSNADPVTTFDLTGEAAVVETAPCALSIGARHVRHSRRVVVSVAISCVLPIDWLSGKIWLGLKQKVLGKIGFKKPKQHAYISRSFVGGGWPGLRKAGACLTLHSPRGHTGSGCVVTNDFI